MSAVSGKTHTQDQLDHYSDQNNPNNETDFTAHNKQ